MRQARRRPGSPVKTLFGRFLFFSGERQVLKLLTKEFSGRFRRALRGFRGGCLVVGFQESAEAFTSLD